MPSRVSDRAPWLRDRPGLRHRRRPGSEWPPPRPDRQCAAGPEPLIFRRPCEFSRVPVSCDSWRSRVPISRPSASCASARGRAIASRSDRSCAAYGPILYRSVLLPRLGAEAIAQDALAETYARVVERFHQFEWQGFGVYPWLRVIAMRIALDMLRARKRETLFDPDDLARELEVVRAGSRFAR